MSYATFDAIKIGIASPESFYPLSDGISIHIPPDH